MFPTDQ
ncbi:unnamed protein product, partial [Didymodactylos carnosus]